VQQPVNLVIKGEQCVPSETPVLLNSGWSWIGYIPQTALEINQALAGSGAIEGDYVKSKSAFAIYGPYGWEGNLKSMEPGKGYMFYSQALKARNFFYPDVTASSRQAAHVKAPVSSEDYFFKPVDAERYSDNMSAVVQLLFKGQPVDTFEVAAFIDGECRAAVKADGGLYYLMIQGEGSGQPVEIRTCFEGKELTIDNGLTFRADTNVGLPWEPYVIELSQSFTTGISTVAQPYADDARYYLPNGMQVDKSSISKGQIYIRIDQSGKVSKIRK
jgi:hypothetical protein